MGKITLTLRRGRVREASTPQGGVHVELAKRLQVDRAGLITRRMYGSEVRCDSLNHGVAVEGRVIALAQARRGDAGVVVSVGAASGGGERSNARGVTDRELEQRLLEIGFVEGARVRVLHEGPFGRDPIAVRVDDTRIALRRREAADVLIELDRRPSRL